MGKSQSKSAGQGASRETLPAPISDPRSGSLRSPKRGSEIEIPPANPPHVGRARITPKYSVAHEASPRKESDANQYPLHRRRQARHIILLRIMRDGRGVNRNLPLWTKRRFQTACLLGGLSLAGTAVFLVASQKSAAPCAARLIQMDGCKKYWAQVNSKTAFDTPTWDDLRPYFPSEWRNTNWKDGQPVCPEGGTYTLEAAGLPPTCSIGGRRHSIP